MTTGMTVPLSGTSGAKTSHAEVAPKTARVREPDGGHSAPQNPVDDPVDRDPTRLESTVQGFIIDYMVIPFGVTAGFPFRGIIASLFLSHLQDGSPDLRGSL